jgi:transposase
MPAHAKFTRRRERRLVELVVAGATIAEASRAVEVSRMTVYRHARADPALAARLCAARTGHPTSVELLDWREIAERLERTDPLRWGSPQPKQVVEG